jgi:hypothetical protein
MNLAQRVCLFGDSLDQFGQVIVRQGVDGTAVRDDGKIRNHHHGYETKEDIKKKKVPFQGNLPHDGDVALFARDENHFCSEAV